MPRKLTEEQKKIFAERRDAVDKIAQGKVTRGIPRSKHVRYKGLYPYLMAEVSQDVHNQSLRLVWRLKEGTDGGVFGCRWFEGCGKTHERVSNRSRCC